MQVQASSHLAKMLHSSLTSYREVDNLVTLGQNCHPLYDSPFSNGVVQGFLAHYSLY